MATTKSGTRQEQTGAKREVPAYGHQARGTRREPGPAARLGYSVETRARETLTALTRALRTPQSSSAESGEPGARVSAFGAYPFFRHCSVSSGVSARASSSSITGMSSLIG